MRATMLVVTILSMRTTRRLFAAVFLFTIPIISGCSTSWKLGPQEQEAIKQASNTGQVIGDLSGVPGGGSLGALIGTGIATMGTGFGLYKHGKDKGWDEAAGKPGTPGAASSIAAVKA